MDPLLVPRRRVLRAGSALAIALAAGGLRAQGNNGEKEVEAAEDLMRETFGEQYHERAVAMVLMYQHHTAIEDTVVFPAWKEALTDAQYKELSEKFEELEQKMFGRDGFEDAVKRVAAIESEVGLANLASFTAPLPPRPGRSSAGRR